MCISMSVDWNDRATDMAEGGDVSVPSARRRARRQQPLISVQPEEAQNGDVTPRILRVHTLAFFALLLN